MKLSHSSAVIQRHYAHHLRSPNSYIPYRREVNRIFLSRLIKTSLLIREERAFHKISKNKFSI